MNKEWNWRNKVSIPEVLLQGDVFDRYDDESNILDPGCSVRLDEHGFYLVWKPKGKDAGILDMTQVWEARPSGTIKDGRVLYELEQRGKCGLAGETLEERTVWLTYGLDLVIVNGMFLIARTAQVAREWRSAINEFIRGNKFRHACPMHCLQKHWHSICLATNDRNRIPLRNIVRTFASGKPEKMVHKCLADLGLSGDKEREDLDAGLFTFEKFLRLYHKICPRTEVQELFVRLSGQKEYLTRDRLLQFLNDEQRDPRLNEILFPHFDQDRVQQLIAKYESDESYIAQGKMSGDGFLRFLLSDENSPVFLDRNELYQDMEQPLCHYFINSSHNTYLTGRQYGGKSSTEVYRQVLLSGCRCIELDCWDGTGENKGEPIITHGKAMCTDVFFKEVLYQIKETAFARSDFPVILSFENHCSKSNQLKMAKYCLEIFGDMLLIKPLDEHPLEPGVTLPSPNRLRRKILIKNKRLKKEEERRQMEALSQGRLLDEEDPSEDQPTQPTSTAADNSGEDCSGEQQAMSPRVMHGSPDYELSLSFDLAEDPTLAVHCPVSSPRTAPVSRCGDTGDASSSRRASMGPLSQVILPMALGPESSCSSRNCSPRNSFVFSPISAPLSSCSGPTDLRHSFLFSAFHPELRRSKRRRDQLADSFGNRVTAAKELLRAALHSHGETAARSPSPGGRSQQQREKKDSITSDQRAHPEAEDDLRGGDAPASAIPSHLCCSSHPPAKPRLGPTASSASFHANEFVPSAVSPIVHRASLSNTSSRQNSTVALGSSTQHLPGTPTPPGLFGDDCAGSVDLNKTSTLISKIKQPLGLTRKVQPALTKEEEEERLFKLVSDQEEVQESYHYQGATTNIHPLLSSLINYTHPVKFSGFDVAEQNDLHFHMSSFSESTGLGLLKQSALEFVNYNKRQLSRIYPKGARVDSSNFLPQIFWNVGCQLVALNFQTPDVCMQLNVGKFEYNNQCGYLLKPDFMRRPDRTFDPFSESPVDGVIAAHCSVRIISGQFLCERKTGTYVEVEMYGLPTDTIRKEHRTKLVPANGLNPIYNEEPFVFRKVILPELAVLRFAVYDENGKQLGQRILPLDGLQSGYRHISLRTEHNQAMALPTLFVHLQLKTYVPDEFSGFVDALADPRAYLSAQEKREEALQQMCKDELDIVEEIVPNQSQQQQISVGRRDRPVLDGVPFDSNTSIRRLQNGGSGGGRDQQTNTTAILITSNAQSPVPGCKDAAQSSRVQVDGQTETKFQQVEWINIADLRREKPFLKLQKQLAKEWVEMKKKHQKMRESVQKQQQANVDRLVEQSQKLSLKKRSHLNSTSLGERHAEAGPSCRHSSLAGRVSDPAQNSAVVLTDEQQMMRSLVQSQTDEWSQLLRHLEQEEFEQHKGQILKKNEMLKQLLILRQKQQMATLRAKFVAESKELIHTQVAKNMVDKQAIQQDRNAKTKAEKDRRKKELNEKNLKQFMEERKRLGTKRSRHEEQLIKKHNEQSEQLEKEAAKALELEEMSHRESLLASQPQCIV